MKNFTSFIIGMVAAFVIASTISPAQAAESYDKEHYRALMKAWATATVEQRPQLVEVFWTMQATDIEAAQKLLPLILSPATTTFAITQEGRTQSYSYHISGVPYPRGSSSEQKLMERIIRSVCADDYSSFQLIAMGGTIVFNWHFDKEGTPYSSLTLTAESCGQGI